MKSRERKPIEYYINENGCHICTSHKPNKDGYPYIHIDGRNMSVHRYIFEKAYGRTPLGIVIRHRCDNPACCNIKHLEAGSQADNVSDMVARNRQARGTNIALAKLTDEQVLEILNDKTHTTRQLSKKYGVSNSVISMIHTGKLWTHVPRPDGHVPRGRPLGEKSGRSKLTNEQVLEIYNNRSNSLSQAGHLYGVNKTTIASIRSGKTWTHLTRPAATKTQ